MAALSGSGGLAAIMERFEIVCTRVDAEVVQLNPPLLPELHRRTGIRYSYLLLGGILLLFAFLFLGFGASLLSTVIGFVYPAFASFKAIESPSRADDKQWLAYWVVFAVFSIIECFSDTVLFWFPMYYSLKVIFLVYLQLPHFRGAEHVYNTFLRPIFVKHAPAIEEKLSRARDVTGNLARALELTGPAAAAAAAAASAAEEGGERDLSASQVFGPSAGRKAE